MRSRAEAWGPRPRACRRACGRKHILRWTPRGPAEGRRAVTADLRAAAAGTTPEDRSHLELKHLYLEELHRNLASEKARARSRGIRWIIDYTETHPVAVHSTGGSSTTPRPTRSPSIRPDRHRAWVWSDLHLRHANIIKHCNRPGRVPPVALRRTARELLPAGVDPDADVVDGFPHASARVRKDPVYWRFRRHRFRRHPHASRAVAPPGCHLGCQSRPVPAGVAVSRCELGLRPTVARVWLLLWPSAETVACRVSSSCRRLR